MKKSCLVLALIFSIMMCQGVFAENIKDWKYSKDINLSGEGQYKGVFLDNEVYEYANSDLSDLRIADKNGDSVAYFIQDSKSYESYSQSFYNTVLMNKHKEFNNTIFDFRVIPEKLNVDILANRLMININSSEFLKDVQIYGSYDGMDWNYLLQDNIYSVNGISKNTISFPGNYKYKFYRVIVVNNIENYDINSLKAGIYDSIYAVNFFTRNIKPEYEISQEGKTTLIDINNKSHLKLKTISINADGIYNRTYEIMYKDGENYYSTGISGVLYSLNFKNANIKNNIVYVNDKQLNKENIRIVINNKDDRPLNIKGLSADYNVNRLVFQDINKGPYKLYFGNRDALKPSYDIESYREHIEKENIDEAKLGNLTKYETQTKEGIKTDYSQILNIVIILVAIGLVGLTVFKLNVRPKKD